MACSLQFYCCKKPKGIQWNQGLQLKRHREAIKINFNTKYNKINFHRFVNYRLDEYITCLVAPHSNLSSTLNWSEENAWFVCPRFLFSLSITVSRWRKNSWEITNNMYYTWFSCTFSFCKSSNMLKYLCWIAYLCVLLLFARKFWMSSSDKIFKHNWFYTIFGFDLKYQQ